MTTSNGKNAAPGRAWHVVHLIGRSDKAVAFWLERMKFDYYYPHIRELRPLPRRKLSHQQRAAGVLIWRPRLVPFFPRYMFIRFDFKLDRWREIFDIAGIHGLICEQGLPVRVADVLIDNLKAREIEGAIDGKTPAGIIFNIGDRVRITGGPMKGHSGMILEVPQLPIEDVDTRTRLKLTVDWFGRATPVDLDLDHVLPMPVV